MGVSPARLTAPAAGTTWADLEAPFEWTPVSGAQAYYLYVGTEPGSTDVINSGELQETRYVPPASVMLPVGQTLHARM
jgi:hypothetical protein